ncbi:DNase I-like protein [Stipitochalara longipes BDJ]|nr:DNase I-like protein [Stipitochalara longipes BDJ]
MSSPPRKRLHTEEKEISPPPLRRKLNDDPSTKPRSQPAHVITKSASEPKPAPSEIKTRFEILSWNVNGISHLLPPTQPSISSFFQKSSKKGDPLDTDDEAETADSTKGEAPLRKFLRRHNFPEIVCLQEVKISAKDERMRGVVERAANSKGEEEGEDGKGYKAYFELPRDRFNATGWGGKVYGVCKLVREDVIAGGKVVTKGVEWDLEGRVLVSEVQFGGAWVGKKGDERKKREKLVVINGYWPNGTLNPWRDSKTGIVKGTRHDMKRKFHSLMLEEVLRYQDAGWQVVLIGDMNIAQSPLDGYPGIRLGAEHVRNRKEWNESFIEGEEGMRGVDSWRWIHGEKGGYSYHGERAEEWGRSCDRVDLGVVSRGLVGEEESGTQMRLVGAEIWESVEERGGSDHVPISVVLDLG